MILNQNNIDIKKSRLNYTYNPFEINLINLSSNDNFVKSVIEKLNEKYKIAYFRANPNEIINRKKVYLEKLSLDNDLVIVESKKSLGFKIEIIISEDDYSNEENLDIKKFNSKEIPLVIKHIEKLLFEKVKEIPLFGLILSGGKSSRMGKDKGSINYHNVSQISYCENLLKSFCSNVYLSVNQKNDYSEYNNLKKIVDNFNGYGPLSGILSAMFQFPNASWLVLACDLPLVDNNTLNFLIKERNPFKYSTTYNSSSNNLPEPLCTIYEPKMKSRMLHFLSVGYSCPRKILLNSEIKSIQLENKNALDNANSPKEFENIKKYLQGKIK